MALLLFKCLWCSCLFVCNSERHLKYNRFTTSLHKKTTKKSPVFKNHFGERATPILIQFHTHTTMNTEHHFLEIRAKNETQFSSVIQKHLCFFITTQTLRFKEHLQKWYPSCLQHCSCLYTQYIKEKKKEEKMWVLQTSCLEIVLPIYYKLMQGFCLNNQKKFIFTEQPFFYKIIDQMLLSVIPC